MTIAVPISTGVILARFTPEMPVPWQIGQGTVQHTMVSHPITGWPVIPSRLIEHSL
jgi:hypothetical protein